MTGLLPLLRGRRLPDPDADLLARFVHLQVEEKRDDQGRRARAETMIFPRYHQLQAVRQLAGAARAEGPGGSVLQRLRLEREGVGFDTRGRIPLERYGWRPRGWPPPRERAD